MLTVEKCEVIPETKAWKIFVPNPPDFPKSYTGYVMPGQLFRPNYWYQANPRLLDPMDQVRWQEDPLTINPTTYYTGFHTFEEKPEWLCVYELQENPVAVPVMIRGIAYYGWQDQKVMMNLKSEETYKVGIYGWTAQEMMILDE